MSTSSERPRSVLVSLALGLGLVGCGDLDSGAAVPLELGSRYLLVSNASLDFQSGSLGAVALGDLSGRADVGFAHSDSVVRVSRGHLFTLNRRGADNLQRLDPATLASLWQYSVGPGANPQDVLVFDDDRAYVTRYDAAELWIVDVTASHDAGFQLGTIDLAAYADADGLPEMGPMVELGGRVYVALQRLDRAGGFVPREPSRLVALDPATDTVVDLDPSTPAVDGLDTPHRNPIALAVADTELWVACVGVYGEWDGALERFDPATGAWREPLVTEAALEGDLAAFAPGAPAVVLWTDARFETHAALFDTETGAERVRLADALSSVQDLASDDAFVYLVDRNRHAPGIRVFDRTTGDEVTTAPISTGLLPWSLEIVDRTTAGSSGGAQ